MNNPIHIASCSFGKDSIATLLLAYLHNEPLDRVLFVEVMFDHDRNITGELPEHVEFVRNVAIPRLQSLFGGGVKFDIVRPKLDYMKSFHSVVTDKSKHKDWVGKQRGWLIGGRCKMNGEGKMEAIKRYYKSFAGTPIIQYVGIAIDEPVRLERMHKKPNTISLLEKYNYTEDDAMKLCEQFGLVSPQYQFGTRNGCWFCPNMRNKQRCIFRKNHPELWNELVELNKTPDKVSECFSYDATFEQVCKRMDFIDRQTTLDFE